MFVAMHKRAKIFLCNNNCEKQKCIQYAVFVTLLSTKIAKIRENAASVYLCELRAIFNNK